MKAFKPILLCLFFFMALGTNIFAANQYVQSDVSIDVDFPVPYYYNLTATAYSNETARGSIDSLGVYLSVYKNMVHVVTRQDYKSDGSRYAKKSYETTDGESANWLVYSKAEVWYEDGTYYSDNQNTSRYVQPAN
ncbi:hypothetical protein VQL36_20425 [Chengkuizengella sp. SCS-71B]|uniref:hypothetical protein n=1 Tax=Chengkuizengella sp. SCS-71B TaxID=3115290 RepID=UPI0032C23D45